MELSLSRRLRVFALLTLAAPIIAAAFGVSALLTPKTADAAQTIPYKINFQGRLTDNSGNILPDGLYNIRFRLYDDIAAGNLKWTENRVYGASDNRIQITNGLFNIQFGDVTALSTALFSGAYPLYLEVELPTPASATCATNGCAVFTEGPMTPRQPMASSAYAFNSDTLDGLDSAAFGQLSSGNTFTGANVFTPTAGVGISVQAAAATHSLDVKDSSGTTQAYFDAAGILNVGQTIQATVSTVDLGTSGSTFRTGYFGTSVQTPALNAAVSGGTITTNLGTLQRVASGTTTVDLKDAGTTTLAVTNSGGGVAGISATGGLTIGTGRAITVGSTAGTAVTCSSGQVLDAVVVTGGVVTGGTCVGSGGGDKLTATWTSQQATTATNTQTTVQFTGAANSTPSFNNVTHVLTLPSNTSKIVLETKAGGGGGGSVGATNAVKAAGGGGEGGYSKEFLTGSLATNYYFKVGAGGTGGASGGANTGVTGSPSCFGTNAGDACTTPLVSAVGGLGGVGTAGATSVAGGAGGAAASGVGDVKLSGAAGANSTSIATTAIQSGAGGGQGGGVGLAGAAAAAAGNAGTSGGGGSGAIQSPAAVTSRAGGNGGDGFVVVSVYTTVAGTGSPTTLQTAYSNSTDPEIVLSGSGLSVRDTAGGIGGNLFEVQDNSGTTNYFAVNSSGLSTSGSLQTANAAINSSGDVTSTFTSLGTSTTANGAGTASTSLALASATGFVIGNYVQMNSANCGGAGVNPCYSKITNIVGNVLTITPALTWANNSTVVQYHVPEIGGIDTSQALANRFGRGYFISGVAAGNGTTYYNEDSIDTSLSTFNLLSNNVATLNIGTSATSITLGTTGTTINVTGDLSVTGNISAPATGIAGYLSRTGTTLSPATVGDSITTSGNISTTGTGTITAAGGVNIGASAQYQINGTQISSAALSNDANITKQGNSFNGVSQLVQTTAGGALPALSAANLTSIPSANLTGALPAISGASLTSLSSSALTGALPAISGASLTSLSSSALSGALPAISGASLTGINPTNLSTGSGAVTLQSAAATDLTLTSGSGTIGLSSATWQRTATGTTSIDLNDASATTLAVVNSGTGIASLTVEGGISIGSGQTYKVNGAQISSADLSNDANITKQGNIFNGINQLIQATGSGAFPALNGAAITSLSAANLSGALPAISGSSLTSLSSSALSGALPAISGASLTSLSSSALSGALPAISGASLTNLNPTNLSTGSGAITLQSAASSTLTITSGTGTVTLGSSTLQRAAVSMTMDVSNAGASTFYVLNSNGANVANLDATGGMNIGSGQLYKIGGTQISSAALSNDANITKQGNTFNGTSQLIQTTAGGAYPALNGSAITSITSGNLSGALPAISGASLTNLNPTSLSQGSGAVALQSATATALSITSNAAATWQTSGANLLTLQSGSGTLSFGSTTILSNTGASLTINSNTASNLILDSGTTGSILIGGGTTSAKTISVGPTATNTNATTINVGVNTAGTQDINIGSAATADAAAGTLINIQGGTTANTAVVIGTNGAGGITMDTGTTGSILIGGGTTSAKTISLGATATNTNTTILNLGVNTAGTQDVNIGSTGANNAAAGTAINIQGGTTANTAVTIGTNAGGGITIDTGTTGSILIGNGASAKSSTLGSTNTTSTTNILGGTTGAINIGSVGTSVLSSTTNIGTTTDATGTQIVTIGSNANAANAVTIDAGNTGKIQIGDTATAHTIEIGSGSAAGGNAQTILIGSNSTTTASKVTLQGGNISTTNGNSGVIIGSGYGVDTNLVVFTLDSSSTFAETAGTCSASVNGGSLYYNSTSNAVRGCINGAWEDLVSTASLGLQLFGVVPDSGTNPGDLASVTGAQNGPCKVSVGTNTTTVSWQGCVAFSGGRKVIVAAGTATTAAGAANDFAHLCLNGANNQPALSARGTEVANLATVSLPSVTSPILCLADIKFTGAAATITQIYDTRTYTTTEKVTISVGTTAPALGHLVAFTATKGVVIPNTTATGSGLAGVIVATTGATSTNTVNAIIAMSGPAAVKSITGTNAISAYLLGTTTAGYANTAGAKPTESTTTIYNVLGNARTAWSGATACTANNDTCAGSVFTYIDKR